MFRVLLPVHLDGTLKKGHIECDLSTKDYARMQQLEDNERIKFLMEGGNLIIDSYEVKNITPCGDYETYKI